MAHDLRPMRLSSAVDLLSVRSMHLLVRRTIVPAGGEILEHLRGRKPDGFDTESRTEEAS